MEKDYVKSSILHRELTNSLLGFKLMNANGDIDTGTQGFKYVTDTMSYIRSKVIEQKFYEVSLTDYVPFDVGEAAWKSEIVQNLVFNNAGGFFQGDVDTMSGNGRIANVDASLSPIRMPVKTWAKSANWTVMELEQAASASNWDIVESKLKAMKKNWDLGLQEVAFLGHPADTLVTGLLNDASVNNNTSLITKRISSMSGAEFSTLVAGLLTAYFANSNSTVLPDTFIIPTDDYLGLGVPVSSTYPNISMLEYLTNSLKKMTANENFRVLPSAYAQATINTARGLNKERYVLYRNDADTLSMTIPVDLTMLSPNTSNNLLWQQPAYGQYSGVLINRKSEVLYFSF